MLSLRRRIQNPQQFKVNREFSLSATRKMRVVPVPVRSDNYAYLLIDESNNQAAVVDPFDMNKVQSAVQKEGVQLIATLTTHHHNDHSGGNGDFASAYPKAPIYGGSKQCEAATVIVKDKDEFTVGDNIIVKCLATPCHTQDSICYYVTDKSKPSQAGGVFTGDTLFQAGCGRFFEGTGEEMHAALSYLGTLPDSTTVYNGHEYTKASLAFGKYVDPNNAGLKRLQSILDQNNITTGKSTIGDEKSWNVFMRLDTAVVRDAVKANSDTPVASVMDALRAAKNNFRG